MYRKGFEWYCLRLSRLFFYSVSRSMDGDTSIVTVLELEISFASIVEMAMSLILRMFWLRMFLSYTVILSRMFLSY